MTTDETRPGRSHDSSDGRDGRGVRDVRENHESRASRERPGASDREPALIGAGLRPVEDRLRRALDDEARAIAPADRLGAILADANAPRAGASAAGRRGRRWLVPAAAAAAALLVAGTAWVVSRPGTPTSPPVASTPTAAATATAGRSSDTPSTGPSTGPSTAPSSVPTQTATGPTAPASSGPSAFSGTATTVPPATTTAVLPVYYLGPVVAGSDRVGLFREFVPGTVAAPATPESKALGALRLATGTVPAGSGYLAAWAGVTVESVAVGGDVITVRLSSGTTDTSGLAAEQLAWTVQAALGQSLPVRFELADGGSLVAPGHPVSSTVTRPTDPQAVLEQVAPIWVDEPRRGAVVAAGAALRVSGVASVFEANVEWELLRGGARVDSGFTTASEAAPARGTYAFRTQAVPAGDYVLRVFATSAESGAAIAEQRVPVTAR